MLLQSVYCFTKFFKCTQPLMTPSCCSTSPEDFFLCFSYLPHHTVERRATVWEQMDRRCWAVTGGQRGELCGCPGGPGNRLRRSGACELRHFRTQITAPLWGCRFAGLHPRVTEKTKVGRYDINLMEQNRNCRPGGGPSLIFSL